MRHRRPRKGGAGVVQLWPPISHVRARLPGFLTLRVACRTTEEMTLLEVPLVINPADEDEGGEDEEGEGEDAAGKRSAARAQESCWTHWTWCL